MALTVLLLLLLAAALVAVEAHDRASVVRQARRHIASEGSTVGVRTVLGPPPDGF